MIMRTILLLFFAGLFLAGTAYSQTPDGGTEQVKVIKAPQPVFPAEAKDYVYGDSVTVAMDVDKKGIVREVRAYGPQAPCSNLKDPLAAAIRKAAFDAGKATVFEPILKNGKPVEASLTVTFRLRPPE